MTEIPILPNRQSRLGSLIEVCINILIGFWINFAMNLLIFPFFGFHISLTDNLRLGVIYTFVSVARGYMVRRWFEAQIHRAAMKLAGERNG
jgi:hypothetical protein